MQMRHPARESLLSVPMATRQLTPPTSSAGHKLTAPETLTWLPERGLQTRAILWALLGWALKRVLRREENDLEPLYVSTLLKGYRHLERWFTTLPGARASSV